MNLYQSQDQYYQAILNLIDNRQFNASQLTSLELKLVETIFLGAHRQGILDDPLFYMKSHHIRTGSRVRRDELSGNSPSFINGRNAWSRMQVYQQINDSASAIEKVMPLLGLADWHRLFNRRGHANDLYLEARDYLLAEQVDPQEINALLNPLIPVQLPDFAPRPHSRRSLGIPDYVTPEWTGYVDVSFNLNKYGSVHNLKIIASSENATGDIISRLRRVLRHSPFRPALRDIEQGTTTAMQLRYYFAQM